MRTPILIASLLLASAPCVLADVILTDGTFHEFVAYTVGAPAEACAGRCLPSTNPAGINYSVATPWTFTGPANLLVLDLFLSGDQYEVFDNSVSLGVTSTPGAEIQCGDPLVADIGCSIATPDFSRLLVTLGDGAHSITINYLVTTRVGHSGAALQLTPVATGLETPEPASIAIVAAGLGALALCRKRRR